MIFPEEVIGWLAPEEGELLYREATNKSVLEVGSYCGRSTICLAQSATRVDSIDTHDGRGTPCPMETYSKFVQNLSRYHLLSKVRSFDSYKGVDDKYDFAFIDASHDYQSVRYDIKECSKRTDILIFHDYGNEPGVTKAVDELEGEVLNMVKSILIKKIKK